MGFHNFRRFAAGTAAALATSAVMATTETPEQQALSQLAPRMDRAVAAGRSPADGLTSAESCINAWADGTVGMRGASVITMYNELVANGMGGFANKSPLRSWSADEMEQAVDRLRAVTPECQPYLSPIADRLHEHTAHVALVRDLANADNLIFAMGYRATDAMEAHAAAGKTASASFCHQAIRYGMSMANILNNRPSAADEAMLDRFVAAGQKICPAPAGAN